ncbi:MAG TPA: glycosyltransferase family 39 protein [Ktedonobacteraceae bacterium]
MSTVFSEKPVASLADKLPVVARLVPLRSWLLCWEIYPIVLVAAFLRLYQFNTTEFEADEANYFQMARYAVTHGLIPATSNLASINIYNPPASIDLFMLPAAFTNDPLWVAISVAIVMTISVVLTYGFVRCYYGRVAATIAALMYGTLFRTVVYSRSIWNTNLLPLFVLLFVMALFRGVVARRKGWLFPALFLLGLLIQLHATGVLMIIPLGMALLLAPATIRWQDLALGLLSVFVFYFPYLVWEVSSRFYDIHILVQTFLHPQQKAVFDNQAWLLYQTLFNPYDILSPQNPYHWFKNILPYLDESSMLWQLAPYLTWISILLIYLVIACTIITLVLAVLPRGISSESSIADTKNRALTDGDRVSFGGELSDGSPLVGMHPWRHVRCYWSRLRNSPYRCGLLVLVCWQVVLPIILAHHSLPLYQHYFLFLMPGPFILVGIILAKTAGWLRNPKKVIIPGYIQRYGTYITLAGLMMAAQVIGAMLDTSDTFYSALLMSGPLWQVIAVSLLVTASVLLVYSFVRRYYGRGAAALAALMYGILFRVLAYSPSQWNVKLLPLFVALFVMTLLWGIIARGKGWLFPALLLLGFLMQLYPAAILMIAPVGIAVRLAPGTTRWRDLVLGLLSLLIIDLPDLLGNISLVVASVVTTLVLALWSWNSSGANIDSHTGLLIDGNHVPFGYELDDGSSSLGTTYSWRPWGYVRHYWSHLRNSPSRCGSLILLCWQWVPLMIFFHQSTTFARQYFLFFLLPAPCILAGIFLAKTVDWLRSNEGKTLYRYMRHYGVYALAGLIIMAQFIGSTAGIFDIDLGHYSNGYAMPAVPGYDLRSLRTAITAADQLAQRNHLKRVYISTDWTTQDQLQLLSTQMHTPVTLFDANCVPLPSLAEGPAVMLIGPYNYWVYDLAMEVATVTLKGMVGKPIASGGSPFGLYIVTPKPEQAIPSTQKLSINHGNDLERGISGQYLNDTDWLVTRWSLTHSASPDYRTTYTYTMRQVSPLPSSGYTMTQCRFTAMRAGDQVLIPFVQDNPSQDKHRATMPKISVEALFSETKPIYLHDGPFTFLSFATAET